LFIAVMVTIMKRLFGIVLLCALMVFTVHAQDSTADNGHAWVGDGNVNVRATPNTRGTLLGQFAPNTELVIHGRDDIANNGLWVYVTPVGGGITGWTLSDYLLFNVSLDLNALPVVSTTSTAAPTPAPSTVAIPEGAVAGTTISNVNFRTGAGTNFSVIRRLPRGTTVGITGRNSTGTWLRVVVDGQEGWLSSSYVTASGSLTSLPVTDAATTANTTTSSGGSAIPGVVPSVGSRARRIFLAGQALGNRADVFSKVGDSITASSNFLYPIGYGGLILGDYGYLQGVVNYFSQSAARTHNSFANDSIAARNGWFSGDLLDPNRGEQTGCPGEAPLTCEYRLVRPAVALIMIGTNDLAGGVSGAQFQSNLQTIVQTTIDMGIIPVLSTIPDSNTAPDRIGEFNNIIISVASAYNIPLWNYWLSMQGLPGRGLSGDGVHPSTGPFEAGVFTPDALIYGYNMRNLTALQVLDAVWRGALY
jgi:uncharacterized protein YraI